MSRGGKGAVSRLAPGSPDRTELGSKLWEFALSFYGREGVAPACLALQEQIGADVDIILFGLFALLRRGVSLDAADVREIDALVKDWRSEIVHPLRRMRTRLKSGPSPAPTGSTEELRNRIKAIEIEAERIELDKLALWLARREPHRKAPHADAAELLDLMARYFGGEARKPADPPQVTQALRVLARAARDIAGQRPGSADPHPV